MSGKKKAALIITGIVAMLVVIAAVFIGGLISGNAGLGATIFGTGAAKIQTNLVCDQYTAYRDLADTFQESGLYGSAELEILALGFLMGHSDCGICTNNGSLEREVEHMFDESAFNAAFDEFISRTQDATEWLK